MKNKLIISICLILIAGLNGCNSSRQAARAVNATGGNNPTPTPYPTPVRPTYSVERGDIKVEANLSGRVEPLALHNLYFGMTGQVSDVYAKANDVVAEGQLLAELAEAGVLESQAEETRRTIRRAQINLEIAQLLLEKYKAEGSAEYDLKIQELQVELAQLALEEVLVEQGVPVDADSLDALDQLADKARVYSPADGLVISGISPGRSANPATVAFVIGDPDQLEVVVDLNTSADTEALKQMFEGMPVMVTLDARPETQFSGIIRQLPSPYGTGSREDNSVRILLDQPPSPKTYQSGDKVSVHLLLADKSGVLWLPPEAVRQAGGRIFVIVDSPSGPKRIEVETGLATRERVEIISGLEEGQEVIGQ